MIHKVLLTVPNLDSAASPWREAMGLARHLPREKFKLTICALRPDGVEESRPTLEALGVNCFAARFRPRGRSLRRLIECLRDGRRMIAEGPFDLQHSMDFTSSPFEAIRSSRHARRFVFSQRNMNEGGHPILLKIKARFARRIICVSDAALRFLQRLGVRDKMVRVHPGIEVDGISWRSPRQRADGGIRLLMVGHIARRKGIDDAIGAVAELAAEFPQLRLEIAGRVDDPAYRVELDALIREKRIEGRINFLGPRTDIFELMRESDALLHTAESEAFGMVIIEAMAIGLPVIAPAIQGPQEIIEHNKSGLLVAAGDTSGYAGAVRSLVRNPLLSRQLAVDARTRVENHFSSQRMAEQMAIVYESLL